MKSIFRFNGEHYVRITPVQQLKARIADLNKQVENLAFDLQHSENSNTALNEENANLAFQVDELESTINMLNNTNDDLRAEIDDWRNQ